MPAITKPKAREIIDDFAKEIRQKRVQTAKPSKAVINFRTDVQDGVERIVWRVPIGILRYRKYNGRIASDVMTYERNVGILRETTDEAQAKIARFLEEKDPEKTGVLRSSIIHGGQRDEAIITCDGFLINGNRRKMVMDKLHQKFPEEEKFAYMKCVILPGKDDEGGPPSLLEIEKLENRYQLQSEGKAEYYGFDRALSIKRKMDLGLTLEEQLRDDPQYAGATSAQLQKAIREYERDYLRPLDCVDRYLKQFRRDGQYRTIATGMSDPQGRWQAFGDYSRYAYARYFKNSQKRMELGVGDDEIGQIEEAAFDIIRLRIVPEMPKLHMVMRKLAECCRTREGKKEILKIADEVEPVLGNEECVDNQGNGLTVAEIDTKWAAKNKQAITYHLKKAWKRHETEKEKETPLGLLQAAYKKLTHHDMDVRSLAVSDFKNAREITVKIKDRANELESAIYHQEKDYKKLVSKKS